LIFAGVIIHDSKPTPTLNRETILIAFDRLIAANKPGTYRHKELIKLERNLRRDEKDVGALWKFLDLPPNYA
jgi:hypothetical protein